MNKEDMKVNRFMSIKNCIILVLGLLVSVSVKAQYKTSFELLYASAGMKKTLEQNAGKLITEFNNAQGEKRNLSLAGIDIAPEAASSIFTLWEICPFRCDEIEVVENCTSKLTGGYQVRNIPMIMEPRSGEKFDADRFQTIVLNFDAKGQIESLFFGIRSDEYKDLMASDREVTDLRKRTIILDFVEQFRTAYNKKDLNFLQDIFSDDALIITGRVVQRKTQEGAVAMPGGNVELITQTKKQYLSRLANVFKNNARINVVFENIKVNSHRSNKNVYGVKLVQHWNSGSYSDKGYLFLMWEFDEKDETKPPMIHVRTWQPYNETPKEKVFELGDFKINK
ncbi:nuclear transport factor 2 family protein [Bacteroides sp. 224]|uniref:nuclear transport factor 2 family protein n=1 Tax=Bacteroides sp. 224 TaxID=2302936 RepID=UPI0013D778F3|nr:nuclear transport factor 2 family protein [Bacteroides sp. 224]NDV65263.1 nuclear transport factor 2 family protein [Bacteroides sp. 224]